MTLAQLATLKNFPPDEVDLYGRPIDWAQADYESMVWLQCLRERLNSPIRIIRLAHPEKPTAIDWCCPGKPFGTVVMETMRLPHCSYGFYSGNSVHIDRRVCKDLMARWLAIKPDERYYLKERKLEHLAGTQSGAWLYLAWDWKALQLVVELSESKG